VPSSRSWRPAARLGAAAAALAIGATAFTGGRAAAAAGGWRTVPGPAVAAGASANLTGLAMAAPSLGWACGFTLAGGNAPFEPLLAAWNGRRWRTVKVNLGQVISARLDGLAASSASDAWAVGSAWPDSRSQQPLMLHWNGRRWARVEGAGVPGFGYVTLLGVAVHSAADAWAVGEAESTTKPVVRPVIEHWDGRRWRLVANPRVPPMTALSSVTVAADGEAWAVGTPFTDTGRGVVLHWTKRAWVTSATPTTGGAVLMNGVTAVSAADVWAVGSASADGGPFLPYALHWNGHRWTSVAVPHPGEGNASWEFESVTSTAHGHLVAVGSDSPAGTAPGRALYGAWNGRGWSLRTGGHITQLNAVSFDGRHATWAVGSETTFGPAFRPVVQVNG
jgi:hypothetical protein